jgi:hypothetical protein
VIRKGKAQVQDRVLFYEVTDLVCFVFAMERNIGEIFASFLFVSVKFLTITYFHRWASLTRNFKPLILKSVNDRKF